MASGGLTASGSNRRQVASITRDSATRSTVVVGSTTYRVNDVLPGLQVNSARTFAYLPSDVGPLGISDGDHVQTGLFIRGTNLTQNNENITSVGGIIDGDLTPEQNLPSVGVYRGTWNTAATLDGDIVILGSSGNFTATADFGPRQAVDGVFRDSTGRTSLNLDADIAGNEFSGTFSDNTNADILDANGGFFGPNAEEIAGVAAASDGGADLAITFVGER